MSRRRSRETTPPVRRRSRVFRSPPKCPRKIAQFTKVIALLRRASVASFRPPPAVIQSQPEQHRSNGPNNQLSHEQKSVRRFRRRNKRQRDSAHDHENAQQTRNPN